MTESSQQWFQRVSAAIEKDGYRDCEWTTWDLWPFEGELTVKPLQPPVEREPARHGAGGVDCHSCQKGREMPVDHVIWYDDDYFLTWAKDQSLPFAAMLLPREHADLATLTPSIAARGGELLMWCERAAIDTLNVPRIQVARFGDGGEHLRWWLFARPTGMMQLRGSFLSHWDDVIPPRDQDEQLADMRQFAARLAVLAGGTPTLSVVES